MTNAISSGLFDAAGPQLYRRNAFRITGLPTDTDRRTTRHRQQKIMPALEIGADVDLGHTIPVTADELRTAFDRILGDPRNRLIDELFWRWNTGDSACGCSEKLHREHDAAVRAHSEALDLELSSRALSNKELGVLRELWPRAAARWKRLLRRADFWDHVRHRIAVLDDRQLDQSIIDVLRAELPVALAKPLIQLAVSATDRQRELAEQARAWPAPAGVVADQLEAAAESTYAAVDKACSDARAKLDDGQISQAASIGYDRALPALNRLETLVPHARHHRTGKVRDDVAILFNNCATALTNQEGHTSEVPARKWFDSAAGLATDPQTTKLVASNRAGLDDLVSAFRTIQSRIDELVALGRTDMAISMLRDVKRRVGDGPEAVAVDRMMAKLTGRPPKDRTSISLEYHDAGWHGSGCSALVKFVLVVLVLLVLFWIWSAAGADASALGSGRVRDDASVSTRMLAEEGEYLTAVPTVARAQAYRSERTPTSIRADDGPLTVPPGRTFAARTSDSGTTIRAASGRRDDAAQHR